MRGITKRFAGGLIANDGVDFDVQAGEIHALLGENGAGKSTLMSVLSGLYRPDEGDMQLFGSHYAPRSPGEALARGVGMVHQHYMLAASLTVAENIALGRTDIPWHLSRKSLETSVRELSQKFGLAVDPAAKVWQLSVGEQQRVELLRMLSRGVRVLILDEPTALLAPSEVESLWQALRALAQAGYGIVVMGHKLDEILSIAHTMSILRRGKVVESGIAAASVSKAELAERMVGRRINFADTTWTARPEAPGTDAPQAASALELEGIEAASDRGPLALKGISLRLRAGEIVGVAGVAGNGQRELAEVISGLRPVARGKVLLGGVDITHARPDERVAHGFAYVPEDRNARGVAGSLSIVDNLMLRTYGKPPFCRRGITQPQAIEAHASERFASFGIVAPSMQTRAGALSGGNVQRVVLARELAQNPRVLVAAQPTRGLDVGATEAIHAALIAQRDAGAGIVLISEDLDELMALSDRIVVILRGRIVAELAGGSASREQIGRLMAGVDSQPEGDKGDKGDKGDNGEALSPSPAPSETPSGSLPLPRRRASPGAGFRLVLEPRIDRPSWLPLVQPLISIAAALALGALFLAIAGFDPAGVYGFIASNAFGSLYGLSDTAVKATPILLCALGVGVAARARLWNIGAEGQLLFGSWAATAVALFVWPAHTPKMIVLTSALIAGTLAGMVWALVPALLRAHLLVSEIVTTLMLNYIAGAWVLFFIFGPWSENGFPLTPSFPIEAWMPRLSDAAAYSSVFAGLTVHVGTLISLVAVALVAWLLARTCWGYELRVVGSNPEAARYGGIRIPRVVMSSLLLSGALAGLAGACEVTGVVHRLQDRFSIGIGFAAVLVAWIAKLNPWAMIPASLLLGGLVVGGKTLSPAGIPTVLQGLMLLTLVSAEILARYRVRFVRAPATLVIPSKPAEAQS